MSGVHPCVQRYVERLPDGLASYPECTAKVSLLRDILDSRPLDANAPELHEDLRRLIANPPPVSSWVPEVQFVATSMSIYGRYFGGDDLPGFDEWICTRNAALFRKPLYRVLIALLSPERLLVGASKRWAAFHRGTTLTLLDHTPVSANVKIEFPPHLYNAELLHGFAAGMRAAAIVAGGRNVTSGLDSPGAASAEYWIRWDTR